jgi:hypothetical protein
MLLNKNKPQKLSETDNSTISTEAEEITQFTNEGNSKVSPFGDMGKANLSLSILHEEISFDDYEDYSSATYDRLAKFMNALDWGEGTDVEPIDIPDFYKYEGEGYIINWNKADINYSVVVLDNETVYYIVQKCQPNNGYFDYNYIESHIYKIDYAAFDAGVKDILSQNVSDKGEYLSQRDLMKYFDGEFLYAELYLEKTGNSEIVKPEKESTRKALEGFLENDFMHMLKKGDSADNESSEADYTIVRYYKTGDDTERRETYFITNNGSVSLCAYVIANGDSIPQFPVNFSIDVKEFDAALNDVLSGKNDAKYADKPKHETENKNNTEKHEDVQPTTEKQEQQTTAAPDERQEQQIPENTEPATVSEENDEPEDSRDVFLSAKTGVYIWDKNDKLIASPKTHDFAALNTFSKEKLDPFLDMGMPVPTDIEAQDWAVEYNILRKYIDKDGKLKYSNYYIHKYGHMLVYYYEFENGEWWPYGSDGCGIDYAEVKAMLDEVLESSKLQKE